VTLGIEGIDLVADVRDHSRNCQQALFLLHFKASLQPEQGVEREAVRHRLRRERQQRVACCGEVAAFVFSLLQK